MTKTTAVKPKRSRKKKAVDVATTVPQHEVISSFKGFDQNLQCRGYQFEIGKTYEHEGEVEACKGGFHACEHPLNVFDYYPPSSSRYARVVQTGPLSRNGDDTKVASAKITIEAELRLPDLVQEAVKWVFDRAKWVGGSVATGVNEAATASGTRGAATASGTRGAATASGDQGAATASGTQGAATASGTRGTATASGTQGTATASGYQGTATASGDQGAATASGTQGAATASGTRGAATASGTRGAATASGDQGAATASGYQGTATASGYQGAATASGKHSVAIATAGGKARADESGAIVLVSRNDGGEIIHIRAAKVGGIEGIRPNVWYSLDNNGEFVEVI